jgi:hypothetical protein
MSAKSNLKYRNIICLIRLKLIFFSNTQIIQQIKINGVKKIAHKGSSTSKE